jgi:hypothetical protein
MLKPEKTVSEQAVDRDFREAKRHISFITVTPKET